MHIVKLFPKNLPKAFYNYDIGMQYLLVLQWFTAASPQKYYVLLHIPEASKVHMFQ